MCKVVYSYLVPPLHCLLQPDHSSHSDQSEGLRLIQLSVGSKWKASSKNLQLQYRSKQSLICFGAVWSLRSIQGPPTQGLARHVFPSSHVALMRLIRESRFWNLKSNNPNLNNRPRHPIPPTDSRSDMGTNCTFPVPCESFASLGKCLHNAVHDNGLHHHKFENIHPTLPTPSNHKDRRSELCCRAVAQLVLLKNLRLTSILTIVLIGSKHSKSY